MDPFSIYQNNIAAESEQPRRRKKKSKSRAIQEEVPAEFKYSEQIDEFVKKLLADPNINLNFVPDSVEAALYTKVLTSIINILMQSLSDVKINIAGIPLKITLG